MVSGQWLLIDHLHAPGHALKNMARATFRGAARISHMEGALAVDYRWNNQGKYPIASFQPGRPAVDMHQAASLLTTSMRPA